MAASGQSIWELLRGCFDQLWPQDGDLLRRHLVIVKQALLDWRQCVLNTLEATGFRHNDRFAAQLNSAGGAARLQLEGAYVQDVQDAQDLACAFLQPESSLRAAMQLGVVCQVQLIRCELLCRQLLYVALLIGSPAAVSLQTGPAQMDSSDAMVFFRTLYSGLLPTDLTTWCPTPWSRSSRTNRSRMPWPYRWPSTGARLGGKLLQTPFWTTYHR